MNRERRHFAGADKRAILREHLIDKKPISEVYGKRNSQPTVFYQWQQKLFEQGAVVFDSKAAGGREQSASSSWRPRFARKVKSKLSGMPFTVYARSTSSALSASRSSLAK